MQLEEAQVIARCAAHLEKLINFGEFSELETGPDGIYCPKDKDLRLRASHFVQEVGVGSPKSLKELRYLSSNPLSTPNLVNCSKPLY